MSDQSSILRDAARYEYLRNRAFLKSPDCRAEFAKLADVHGEAFDAIIDAEMAGEITMGDDKAYRMLQVGEALQKGDEVKIGDEWELLVRDLVGGIITERVSNVGFPQGYYRRPITEEAK